MKCHTLENKMLDMLYANVKEAYTSAPTLQLEHLLPEDTPKSEKRACTGEDCESLDWWG